MIWLSFELFPMLLSPMVYPTLAIQPYEELCEGDEIATCGVSAQISYLSK